MSPHRQQMIEATILAGLSAGTQDAYLRAVCGWPNTIGALRTSQARRRSGPGESHLEIC